MTRGANNTPRQKPRQIENSIGPGDKVDVGVMIRPRLASQPGFGTKSAGGSGGRATSSTPNAICLGRAEAKQDQKSVIDSLRTFASGDQEHSAAQTKPTVIIVDGQVGPVANNPSQSGARCFLEFFQGRS